MERRRSLPDVLAGGIFVLIGGAFLVGSLGYELGTPLRMGPGYFPLLVGAIVAVLGLAIVVKGLVAGEVKAYAVTTPERVKSLPDLPTTTEAGMPQLQVSVWQGLYLPAGAPPAIVQKLSDALKKALADQSVIDQMAKLGTAPVPADDATPQAHRTYLDEQLKTWAKIIADAGVKAT